MIVMSAGAAIAGLCVCVEFGVQRTVCGRGEVCVGGRGGSQRWESEVGSQRWGVRGGKLEVGS